MSDSLIFGIDHKVNEVLEQVLDINNTVHLQEAKRVQRGKEELEEARKVILAMRTEQVRIQKRLLRDDLLELAGRIAANGGMTKTSNKPLHRYVVENVDNGSQTRGVWIRACELPPGVSNCLSSLCQVLFQRDEVCLFIGDRIMITDKMAYDLAGNFWENGHQSSAFTSSCFKPLYTFNEPLDTISGEIFAYKGVGQMLNDPNGKESIEGLIRTIPGSYQNGEWKQLGFWGPYVNHEKKQVSDRTPPLE